MREADLSEAKGLREQRLHKALMGLTTLPYGIHQASKNPYEGYRVARWQTPVSDVRSPAMVSLVDNCKLLDSLERG